MRCRVWIVGLVLVVTSPGLGQVKPLAGVWPQFRGPNRDGVSTETGLLKSWPKEGPPLLWQAKGAGRGYASLAIADGKIFTLGDGPSTATDKDEYALCFNEANGSQLWKTKTGPAWNRGTPSWQSSRSTPTVDGESVYVLTAHGSLICLESATGRERWRKNMEQDFGGKKGDGWGYSESVLVDGDWVVCTPGGGKATLVALDKRTGNLVWKATDPGNKGAGHASIVPSTIGTVKVYVQTTASAALGVRARDGKVLWSYPLRGTAVIPTPIVRGDLVFVDVGYNVGGALLRQVADGDGVKIQEIYGLKPALNNKHGGIVLVGDYLYGDKNDGGIPFCAELMTGNVVWSSRGSGSQSASVTAADGNLYIRYANGTMVLVPANPQGYKEAGSFKIPESGKRPGWSHPVVANGKLFLREQDFIFCYDIKQK